MKDVAIGAVAGGAICDSLLLYIAGFSSTGPVAGSFAAWWMSVGGPIVKGSWFAWLQSGAMTGGFMSTSSVAVGSAAGIGAVVAPTVAGRSAGH